MNRSPRWRRERPDSAVSLPRRAALALALTCGFAARATAGDDITALSLEELLDVSIVGASKYEQKQSEVAAAASVITRQEIRAFGWRTVDEALASLPGVYTTYDRQYTYLGTRGFGLPGDLTTRILVTVNGNRVNDPTFDAGPFGRQLPLDIDLVERIEFIPGPGGAVYGQNAMLGVVNIVTRDGASLSGTEVAAGYETLSSAETGRASWGRRSSDGTEVVVSASAMHARGQDLEFGYGASGISGVATGLDGERDNQLFAHVGHGGWSFDLIHGDRYKEDPTGAYLSDPLVPGQYQQDRYELAQLQYQSDLAGDSLHLLARAFAGEYRYASTLVYGTPFAYPANGDWHGGELRLLSTALPAHKLMLGLESQLNTSQNQAVVDVAHPANDLSIPGSGYRNGIYAQDDWRLAERLAATIGVRWDRNDVTGNALSPRAGLIAQLDSSTTLKALYGRAYRAPNRGECCYGDGVGQVANSALRAESIDTLELDADRRISRDLLVRTSVYRWTMHRLITLGVDPASGLPQYQSGGDVEARGLELSADQAWRNGARLRGSVSVQRADYASGPQLPNSPGLLGKLALSAPLPLGGVVAGYEFRYDSRRLSLDGSYLGGYALSNIVLSRAGAGRADAGGGRIDVSLGVYNLFDKRYAQPAAANNWQDAFEQDGRTVRLALTYRM